MIPTNHNLMGAEKDMKHETRFHNGHDCIKFKCKFRNKYCIPNEGGSHGIHGMEIEFYVHGELGVVQFKLSTGWLPQKVNKNNIGVLNFTANVGGKCSHLFPMATDLGYHSYKPHYDRQSSMGACKLLGGKDCYYDGSSLNANDAFYTLLNGGEKELFKFLEQYYRCVFENGKYPKVYEYPYEKR